MKAYLGIRKVSLKWRIAPFMVVRWTVRTEVLVQVADLLCAQVHTIWVKPAIVEHRSLLASTLSLPLFPALLRVLKQHSSGDGPFQAPTMTRDWSVSLDDSNKWSCAFIEQSWSSWNQNSVNQKSPSLNTRCSLNPPLRTNTLNDIQHGGILIPPLTTDTSNDIQCDQRLSSQRHFPSSRHDLKITITKCPRHGAGHVRQTRVIILILNRIAQSHTLQCLINPTPVVNYIRLR